MAKKTSGLIIEYLSLYRNFNKIRMAVIRKSPSDKLQILVNA